MGSPITFSGFNQIDFNVVLNAIMQQESLPLQLLQVRQQSLRSTDTAYATLATKLGALNTAAEGLASSSTVTAYAVTSSDPTALAASDGGAATPGHYNVIVSALAQAQVTASSSTAPDTDTTIVASSGTLTIGGVDVAVTGDVTLAGLRDLINTTADIPASASIIETAPGTFRLVLNGNETGAANAFVIGNTLAGGTGVTFGANAVNAANAALTVNNIAIASETNTLDAGIPGVTLTLLEADPARTLSVDVGRDDGSLQDRVQAFVTAYNDVVAFSDSQAKGGVLASDSLLRGLRSALRASLTAAYGSGTYTRLAEVGLGFTRTGQLTLDAAQLTAAVDSDSSAVATLFAGAASDGAFSAVEDLIAEYTRSDGFVPGARTRLTDEITRIGDRIADVQNRLAVRRAALLTEFIAADQAMSRLNSQTGALSGFGNSLTANPL